jgi:hypothetical protein
MPRFEGFEVMDVSTSLPNDPKVRRLAREHPDQLGGAFLVYVATVADSWQAGTRQSCEDSWPSYLAFDQAVVDALKDVRLLDGKGLVPAKTWRGWFEPARDRRDKTRERWRRANDRRQLSTDDPRSDDSGSTARTPTRTPRGHRAATVAIPSVPIPSESESARSPVGESSPTRARDDAADVFGVAGGRRADQEGNGREKSRPTKVGEVLGPVAARLQGSRR